jgi:hypothetical protein
MSWVKSGHRPDEIRCPRYIMPKTTNHARIGVLRATISGVAALCRRKPMTITFDHTIVWARDKEGAARFFAEIFGLRFEGSGCHAS